MKKLDVHNWKTFLIKDVLIRKKISSISTQIRDFENGDINVVTNTSRNNGVDRKFHIPEDSQKYIHEGNHLSYGAKGGKFFFQKTPWVSTDHVHCFYNENINEYNQIFLCTILNKLVAEKGGWSSNLETKIINEKILLPVDGNGNPDWQFMTNYIKELITDEKEKINKINILNF